MIDFSHSPRYKLFFPTLPPKPSRTKLGVADYAALNARYVQARHFADDIAFMIAERLGPAMPKETPRQTLDFALVFNSPRRPRAPSVPFHTIYTSFLPDGDMAVTDMVLLNSCRFLRHGMPGPNQEKIYVHTLPSRVTPARAAAAAQALSASFVAEGPVTALYLGDLSDPRPGWDRASVFDSLEKVLAARKGTLLCVPTGLTRPEDVQRLRKMAPLNTAWLSALPRGVAPHLAALGLADEVITTGNALPLISDCVAVTEKVPSLDFRPPSLRVLHGWDLDRMGGALSCHPRATAFWRGLRDHCSKAASAFCTKIDDSLAHLSAGLFTGDIPAPQKPNIPVVSLQTRKPLAGHSLDQRMTEMLRLAGTLGPYDTPLMRPPVHLDSGWSGFLDALEKRVSAQRPDAARQTAAVPPAGLPVAAL